MSDKTETKLPVWLKIVIFLAILAILGIVGDLFTFIVGSVIMILIFAYGSDAESAHDH